MLGTGRRGRQAEVEPPGDMTSETVTDLPPREVLELARDFFTGRNAVYDASISEESDTHIAFATFRSRIVVAAFPDPEAEGRTRARVSTLREYAVADKFITYLDTHAADQSERGSAAG